MAILGIYKPRSQNIIQFLIRISLIIDHYLQTYEHILEIGDFNLSVDNSHLEAFMQVYDFSSLMKLLKLVSQTIINLLALV